MESVLGHGACTGPWSLCWTMESVLGHGVCAGPWSLCWAMESVLGHGVCTGRMGLRDMYMATTVELIVVCQY